MVWRVLLLHVVWCVSLVRASVDWRDSGLLMDVEDQGACGSAWALAATHTAVDSRSVVEGEVQPQLSAQHVLECCKGYGCNGCNGGQTYSGLRYLELVGGVEASCKAYTGNANECHRNCDDNSALTTPRDTLDSTFRRLASVSAVKRALDIGPVLSILLVYDDLLEHDGGSVIASFSGSVVGYHAVELVGYGTSGGEDYWIAKNSWGTAWGDDGYFRLTEGLLAGGSIEVYATPPVTNALDEDEDFVDLIQVPSVNQPLHVDPSSSAVTAAVQGVAEHVHFACGTNADPNDLNADYTDDGNVSFQVKWCTQKVVSGILYEAAVLFTSPTSGCPQETTVLQIRQHLDGSYTLTHQTALPGELRCDVEVNADLSAIESDVVTWTETVVHDIHASSFSVSEVTSVGYMFEQEGYSWTRDGYDLTMDDWSDNYSYLFDIETSTNIVGEGPEGVSSAEEIDVIKYELITDDYLPFVTMIAFWSEEFKFYPSQGSLVSIECSADIYQYLTMTSYDDPNKTTKYTHIQWHGWGGPAYRLLIRQGEISYLSSPFFCSWQFEQWQSGCMSGKVSFSLMSNAGFDLSSSAPPIEAGLVMTHEFVNGEYFWYRTGEYLKNLQCTAEFSSHSIPEDLGVTMPVARQLMYDASEASELVVSVSNADPVITEQTITGDGSVGEMFVLVVPSTVVTDADGDSPYYSVSSGMPLWLNFDGKTATFEGTPSSGDQGEYEFELSVADAYGGDGSSINVQIEVANRVPTVLVDETASLSVGIDENLDLEWVIAFEDLDGDTLTYSTSSLPTWASFETEDDVLTLSGIPLSGDQGMYAVDVVATDIMGASASFAVEIKVSNRIPVVLEDIALQEAEAGDSWGWALDTSVLQDPDGDELVYVAGDLPSWVSFDSTTNFFIGFPKTDAAGDHVLPIYARDGHGGEVQVDVPLKVSTVPELSTPKADQVIPVGETVVIGLEDMFVDLDGDGLTYSVSTEGGDEIPDWINFNGTAVVVAEDAPSDSVDLVVVATDGSGNTVESTFRVVVTSDTSNTAPFVTNAITSIELTVGDDLGMAVLATDHFGDNEGPVSLSASDVPEWMGVDVADDGTALSFEGTAIAAGDWQVLVTAEDEGGLRASTTFHVTVKPSEEVADTETFDVLSGGTGGWQIPQDVLGAVSAGGATWSATATQSNGEPLPEWMTFNSTTGTLTFSPSGGTSDTVEVEVVVQSADGKDSFELTVNVQGAFIDIAGGGVGVGTEDGDGDGDGEVDDALTFTGTDTVNVGDIVDISTLSSSITLILRLGDGVNPEDGEWLIDMGKIRGVAIQLSDDGSEVWLDGDPESVSNALDEIEFVPFPESDLGRFTVEVVTEDGLVIQQTVVVTSANRPPTLVGVMPDLVFPAHKPFNFTVDKSLFQDPDGDPLEFALASELPSWLDADLETLLFISNNGGANTTSIQLTASDGRETVLGQFEVVLVDENLVSSTEIRSVVTPQMMLYIGAAVAIAFAAITMYASNRSRYLDDKSVPRQRKKLMIFLWQFAGLNFTEPLDMFFDLLFFAELSSCSLEVDGVSLDSCPENAWMYWGISLASLSVSTPLLLFSIDFWSTFRHSDQKEERSCSRWIVATLCAAFWPLAMLIFMGTAIVRAFAFLMWFFKERTNLISTKGEVNIPYHLGYDPKKRSDAIFVGKLITEDIVQIFLSIVWIASVGLTVASAMNLAVSFCFCVYGVAQKLVSMHRKEARYTESRHHDSGSDTGSESVSVDVSTHVSCSPSEDEDLDDVHRNSAGATSQS